jgi:hypothetical protein
MGTYLNELVRDLMGKLKRYVTFLSYITTAYIMNSSTDTTVKHEIFEIKFIDKINVHSYSGI